MQRDTCVRDTCKKVQGAPSFPAACSPTAPKITGISLLANGNLQISVQTPSSNGGRGEPACACFAGATWVGSFMPPGCCQEQAAVATDRTTLRIP